MPFVTPRLEIVAPGYCLDVLLGFPFDQNDLGKGLPLELVEKALLQRPGPRGREFHSWPRTLTSLIFMSGPSETSIWMKLEYPLPAVLAMIRHRLSAGGRLHSTQSSCCGRSTFRTAVIGSVASGAISFSASSFSFFSALNLIGRRIFVGNAHDQACRDEDDDQAQGYFQHVLHFFTPLASALPKTLLFMPRSRSGAKQFIRRMANITPSG